MYKITPRKLRQSHFCEEHILRFKKVFPGGAPFTLATLQKAQENFLDVAHVFDRACDVLCSYYHSKYDSYDLPRQVQNGIDRIRNDIWDWYIPQDYEYEDMDKKTRARTKAVGKKILDKLWRTKVLRDRARDLIAGKVKAGKGRSRVLGNRKKA